MGLLHGESWQLTGHACCCAARQGCSPPALCGQHALQVNRRKLLLAVGFVHDVSCVSV